MLLNSSVLDKRFSSYAQTDGTCSRQVTCNAAVQTQTNTRLASHNQQLTEYYRAVMKFTSAAKKFTAEFRFVFAENRHSSTLLSLTALSVGTTRVSRYWETHNQSGFYLRLPSTLGATNMIFPTDGRGQISSPLYEYLMTSMRTKLTTITRRSTDATSRRSASRLHWQRRWAILHAKKTTTVLCRLSSTILLCNNQRRITERERVIKPSVQTW